MDLGIAGRTALVLAGGGGLGSAIARELAAEGARVAVAGRTEEKSAAVVDAIVAAGGTAWATPAWDLADLDAVEGRITEIESALNTTGGPPPGSAAGHSAQVWQAQFTAMVLSVISITDRVLPGMTERGWGRIVTSTSSGAIVPIPHLGLSNTLRSSLLGWSKTLAGEVARHGVTVNVVVPGRIETERTAALDAAKAGREGITVEEVRAASTAAIPAGRYGTPREYGQAVAFLASEAASYITGSILRVDGGYIAAV